MSSDVVFVVSLASFGGTVVLVKEVTNLANIVGHHLEIGFFRLGIFALRLYGPSDDLSLSGNTLRYNVDRDTPIVPAW